MDNPYIIKFEQLGLGAHEFEFDIDRRLFSENSEEDIFDVQIMAYLHLFKSENLLDLSLSYRGTMSLPCDRCNSSLNVPIEEEGKLIVKYGQLQHEEHEELLVLGEKEHQIDLKNYFYESISLMIPRRKVHPESECDGEVLKILNKVSAENQENKTDSRWDALRSIKDNQPK